MVVLCAHIIDFDVCPCLIAVAVLDELEIVYKLICYCQLCSVMCYVRHDLILKLLIEVLEVIGYVVVDVLLRLWWLFCSCVCYYVYAVYQLCL